ncbi:uncharacterized protein LOC123880268 isoform X2 [Maniola jurtina]|uniref:uncharacterized protein LOC123880268 isoform X2 n=1 Tax=Maniola jurtina TaxID=191418 RepID=UPI001E689DC8|nr:uncharacterized protein LOC123880268 isoform X2 [Maniola jurtina]
MQTLLALLATALACVLARPPAITDGPPIAGASPGPQRQRAPIPPPREFLTEYILPRFLVPHYLGYDEQLRFPRPLENNFLDREIDFIKQMELQEIESNPYEVQYPRWEPIESPTRYFGHVLGPIVPEAQMYPDQKLDAVVSSPLRYKGYQVLKKNEADEDSSKERSTKTNNTANPGSDSADVKKTFALTPLDSGYYENANIEENAVTPIEEEPEYNSIDTMIDTRKIRQNPNLSKTKTLIAEHVDRLRTGLSNKDYRIPVSLLPTNLRWLKINRPNDLEESTHEDVKGTAKPHHIHILETPTPDPGESIYSIALLAAVGAALTVAIIGLAFGWYTLSKKAKAAADVDYPAYGVTGPNVDTSGDRKLAQSAHMYHYQHQKQQIIAMERNGMDRNASVSDPESEEENEEGDYTVYECPGFATTGDMEVKNPLFKEEGTPATPGKNDGGKVQPKE